MDWVLYDNGLRHERVSSLLTEPKIILSHFKGCERVHLLRWYRDYRNLDMAMLHGFADASVKLYSCCVSAKFRRKDHLYSVSLISAQS